MADTSFPFENQDTTETQFSYLFRELQDPGVIGSIGEAALAVTPGSGLNVVVNVGRAYARGVVFDRSTADPIAVTANPGAARVDRVVIEVDPAANAAILKVIPGTSGSATPPALVQTDTGVYQLPLARLAVASGAANFTAGNITDDRPWVGHRVGAWTNNSGRPSSPRVGRLGWNANAHAFEVWDGSAWAPLAPTELPASVITSGVFSGSRIPDLSISRITDLSAQLAAKQSVAGMSNYTTRPNLAWSQRAIGDVLGANALGFYWDGTRPIFRVDSTDFAIATVALLSAVQANLEGQIAASGAGKANAWGGDANVVRYSAGPTAGAYARTVGSSYYAVYMDGGLEWGRNVSSLRYKEDVLPAADDGLDVDAIAEALAALELRTYVRKNDPKRHRDVGFIAEEVEAVAPWLVIHDVPTETVDVTTTESQTTWEPQERTEYVTVPRVEQYPEMVEETYLDDEGVEQVRQVEVVLERTVLDMVERTITEMVEVTRDVEVTRQETRPVEGAGREPLGIAYETTLPAAVAVVVGQLVGRVSELEAQLSSLADRLAALEAAP